MIEVLALTSEVVVCDRKIDVRMFVWTLVVGFAVGLRFILLIEYEWRRPYCKRASKSSELSNVTRRGNQ